MVRVLLVAVVIAFRSLAQAADVEFERDVRPILQRHCYECHAETNQKSGLRLDIKSEAFRGGDGYGASIVAGKAGESPLIELISSDDDDLRMPPEKEPLSAAEIRTLTTWINAGAEWPEGVDTAELGNRLDHWSFELPRWPTVPEVENRAWPRSPIDHFILSRLERIGLAPASPADAVSWLRRVTLDLTGLPPTVQEVHAFLQNVESGDVAYAAVVERLLNSPRYGERWAQHWLDVVRYADTHGFEVNTERPNAWPYRDYVIESLNRDTPYDRFVREQIVGDALGKDAATGFLVTASVLLPGQIGKDAPSKRLARQDALDEIVNNIGQTFLGLSIGCARCHDHKFDPISAKDYYSMQAFVAGVEYADRELCTPQAMARRKEEAGLRRRVTTLEKELDRLVPLANPVRDYSSKPDGTTAMENTETFPPLEAKFIRFEIHDANLHPSLGLIEPCLDEVEIFSDEAQPRNVGLASWGTHVTASGSRTSASHKLEYIHDGQYGNSRSWMSATKGRGWVLFELPKATRIGQIVWSRDRNGQFSDRLATAYTVQAGLSVDELTTLVHVPVIRPAVQPTKNIDRFPPVTAKRLRFSVLATNRLEACIDELEVYNTAGENVALASHGTLVKTSGDNIVANRHEPRFINDGQFGNARSWMSNSPDKCWVELVFADDEEIDRVVWGRDRDGKLNDRLATEYRVEVAAGEGRKLVADSTDRKASGTSSPSAVVSITGLTRDEMQKANRLLKEKKSLEAKIAAAENGQMAFAGKFREPDRIHLLRRGDPEQPAEQVTPAVLNAIGDLTMPNETAEQEQRTALAEWIASPQNPLAARVMVNRIWQWHFGHGLVDTANDFGWNGTKPSHPQLLDWLACEFVRLGWSIKHMHRLIVLSATYRQSSEHHPKAAMVDADARLLWRYPSRRLEAEAIRDCMLAVSGQLDLTMGGRGFDLFNKRGGLTGFLPVESFSGDGLRRMIYAHRVRRERDAVFGAFDCPDNGQSMARRIESTTPIQALNLFNSQITIEQAEAFARRVQLNFGDDVSAQVREVYFSALSRKPTDGETADAMPIVRDHGLATLCRVLFNSNEFLFLP